MNRRNKSAERRNKIGAVKLKVKARGPIPTIKHPIRQIVNPDDLALNMVAQECHVEVSHQATLALQQSANDETHLLEEPLVTKSEPEISETPEQEPAESIVGELLGHAELTAVTNDNGQQMLITFEASTPKEVQVLTDNEYMLLEIKNLSEYDREKRIENVIDEIVDNLNKENEVKVKLPILIHNYILLVGGDLSSTRYWTNFAKTHLNQTVKTNGTFYLAKDIGLFAKDKELVPAECNIPQFNLVCRLKKEAREPIWNKACTRSGVTPPFVEDLRAVIKEYKEGKISKGKATSISNESEQITTAQESQDENTVVENCNTDSIVTQSSNNESGEMANNGKSQNLNIETAEISESSIAVIEDMEQVANEYAEATFEKVGKILGIEKMTNLDGMYALLDVIETLLSIKDTNLGRETLKKLHTKIENFIIGSPLFIS